MSPTVFRYRGYRFFFSREETRMHVHVYCPDGEAKFWIDPIVALAVNQGLSQKQLAEIHRVIEGKKNEIAKAWHKHFSA
ncbi:MAG TPA: DUF4160 domain-containing protein [Kiritimatiellia bacterium]|nr:DUF4160 domain-containing protein [Kiritimatiellia bacterium]